MRRRSWRSRPCAWLARRRRGRYIRFSHPSRTLEGRDRMSSSRGVTVPDEDVEREAQGEGGGKTKGVGKYADVNGIKLYYEIHGTGHPLILLHGGLGASSMFGPNLPTLAQGRQVIAVDLQGHGRTADIDRPISAELMAGDIAALIKHLKLDRPDVMGYSLGGGGAFFVGLRHPELVRKLVLGSG